MTSDVSMQNMLTATTDAILAGEQQRKIQFLMRSYGVPRHEAENLVELIHELDEVLVIVPPSPRFSRRLKRELMQEARSGALGGAQRMPMRVRLAAVASLVSGLLVTVRRRIWGNEQDNKDTEEAPVLH